MVNKDNARAIRFYEKHGFDYLREDKNPVSGTTGEPDGAGRPNATRGARTAAPTNSQISASAIVNANTALAPPLLIDKAAERAAGEDAEKLQARINAERRALGARAARSC